MRAWPIIDFRSCGSEIDLSFPLALLAGSALNVAAASPSLQTIAHYVNTDGTIERIVDRNTRWESSTPMPTDGPRTAEGHIITETLSSRGRS